LEIVDEEDDGSVGYLFIGDHNDAEADLTVNAESGHVNGRITSSEGHFYEIENVGDSEVNNTLFFKYIFKL